MKASLAKKDPIKNTPHLIESKSRLPASVEKSEEKKKEIKAPKKSIQTLAIGFYSGIASIASTDTVSNVKETAVSDLGYGLTFSWSHHWSEKTSFFAVGSLKKFDFRVADNRTISKASVTHGYVGTGIDFKLGNRFSLAPGVGIGESLVLNSNGGAELSIDKINIPTLSLSTKTKLITFKSGFSFDLNIRAGSMLPTNQKGYKTETGYYYNIGLGSNYDLSGKKLFIDTGMTSRKLKIGPADQSSKDLGLNVGLGWTF